MEHTGRWCTLSVSTDARYTLELYARAMIESMLIAIIAVVRMQRRKEEIADVPLTKQHIAEAFRFWKRYWHENA